MKHRSTEEMLTELSVILALLATSQKSREPIFGHAELAAK